jgi:hypothetical protein
MLNIKAERIEALQWERACLKGTMGKGPGHGGQIKDFILYTE